MALSFRVNEDDKDRIAAIIDYLAEHQAPGLPEPTITDAIRYALAVAVINIVQEQEREPAK